MIIRIEELICIKRLIQILINEFTIKTLMIFKLICRFSIIENRSNKNMNLYKSKYEY